MSINNADPFIPSLPTVTLAVTSVTGRVALPGQGVLAGTVAVTNLGDFDVHIAWGGGTIDAVFGTGYPIMARSKETITIPRDATHVAGITAAAGQTANVNLARGFGA